MKKIDFIGVPLFQGCDRKGVEKGTEIIREEEIVEFLEFLGIGYSDLGDISFLFDETMDKFIDNKRVKYYSSIIDVTKKLSKQVYETLENRRFPFVVGGDHSLAIGTISGASKYYNNLAVIWIDAHTDINTDCTSPSCNAHGMPLAASIGLGDRGFVEMFSRLINPKNIYYIGARDIDPGEQQIIKDYNINLYDYNTVKEVGIEKIIDEVIGKITLSNVDGIHMSFDVDSIDPMLAPGTGVPVEGGLSVEEANEILVRLFKTNLITSFDFVEYNPLLDIDNKTKDICIYLLKNIFETIKNNQL